MNIVMFDTAIGTFNQGDDIIFNSAAEALEPLSYNSFVMRLGTHVSNLSLYHYLRNSNKMRFADSCDYKFIMGTNLLTSDAIRTVGQWPIGPISKRIYKNSIMMGAGITQSNRELTFYTKSLYKDILRRDIAHSVRDEESKALLESVGGIHVIDTGCPTLWGLTPEVCANISVNKARNAVMTVSGQKKYQNPERDQLLIDVVERNYDKIYLWIQTYEDEGYFESLEHTKNITYIYSLKQYGEICDNADVDYVGTRLHGGIYAMQHGVRSVIVEIDHRAKGFREINNINTIPRTELEELEDYINHPISTEVHLREQDIKEWMAQFC